MNLQDTNESLALASSAVARRTAPTRASLRLDSGITLELHPVGPMLINLLRADFESRLPSPPTVWLEDKQREEENPNDPAYLAELERMARVNDVALSDAIDSASYDVLAVPEGYFGPEDDGWLQDTRVTTARAFGLSFDPGDAIKRRIVWLRYYALESYVDARLYDNMRLELVGLSEQAVQEAMATFRGDAERGADRDGESEQPGGGGSVNRAARRRAGKPV